jgi:peptidoglycan/xylan/chitin deacetylase (PgdA/CDA1 family)
MEPDEVYHADSSLKAKLLRRLVRWHERRPAPGRVLHPMVSFTFDDGHLSAVRSGAAQLAPWGFKGTYFVCGTLLEGGGPFAKWEDIARLQAEGHEIACHTFSHLDCGRVCASEAEMDADRNRDAFVSHGLAAPNTFAYPFGSLSFATKAALASRFALLRGVHPGLVTHGTDLNQAPAVSIDGDQGDAAACVWLTRAAARPAWLILFTHDVSEAPSPWGCSPSTLFRLVKQARDTGMEVVTVSEGARRLRACS